MRKILFTGGGSGGHVTLNLSLIPLFKQDNWEVIYIGSKNGIEKELVAKISHVKYYAVETGKLRRYFSWQNLKDALKIPVGIFQAFRIIRKENPDIIFSKGGFVSFPVVVGGFLNGKKIFMHESDVTPGLANKMSLPFVHKFFTTFIETQQFVSKPQKVKYIGPVLSDRLCNGSKSNACKMLDFADNLPIIMFIGGSLGAKSLNQAVEKNFASLIEKYQIIHICGKGQKSNLHHSKYRQFEFVDQDLKDLMAASDVIISRSGSNAIFELWSLAKPMVLVPLPSTSSRGEQSLNAQSFQRQGFAEVIKDEDVEKENVLLSTIDKVYNQKDTYITNMRSSSLKHTSAKQLFEEIING